MGRRIRLLGIVLILCFGLVIVQLTNIQFRRAPALARSATNPVNNVRNFNNDRGDIFAANGQLLADSVRIAPPGAKTYQFQRQYPMGAVFSQLVGTYSPIYHNTGVEAYYSSYLGQHKQSPQTLSQLFSPPPPTVDNITLTVNPTLQADAIAALNNLPGPNKDGAVVMLDPKSGAVLALASNVTYDPNPLVSTNFSAETAAWNLYHVKDGEGFAPIYPFGTYDPELPGSAAKVITTAAVYNLDPTLASYSYPVQACEPVPETGGLTICNDADTAAAAGACGGTMVQMLPESCDPGYAHLGSLLGPNNLSQQAALFGFNTVPPLDLPTGYVQPSTYPTAQELSQGGNPGVPGLYYSAFGQQDVSATALQMALVAAAVANGGAEMVPHLLEKVTDAQGRVVDTYKPQLWHQSMSASAAAQIIPLMQPVATSGTAAGDNFPASLNVAVKTGTAQVGYPVVTSNADWMIGFAPANDPKVAIAVVVPFQASGNYGATIAGPIVRTMLEDALG